MRHRLGIPAVLALFGAGSAFGCQWLAELDRPADAVDTPTLDAGVDAPLPSACAPTLPAQPLPAKNAGDLSIQLVLNYVSLDAHPADAGVDLCPTSGFLLDSQCEAFASSAQPCRTSCRDAGARDTDDVLGDLVARIRLSLPRAVGSTDWDPVWGLEHGGTNIMMRIIGYNGEADDDDVQVQIYGLTGLAADTRAVAEASTLDASSWQVPWDRQSLRAWNVDPDTVNVATFQAKSVATGYVADHLLVAHATTMPSTLAGVPLRIEHATFSGELQATSDGWRLMRGRIGAEAPIAQIRAALQTVGGRDGTLCEALPSVVEKERICEAVDRKQGEACDALSLAASFTMVEGRLGQLVPPPAPKAPCEASLCP